MACMPSQFYWTFFSFLTSFLKRRGSACGNFQVKSFQWCALVQKALSCSFLAWGRFAPVHLFQSDKTGLKPAGYRIWKFKLWLKALWVHNMSVENMCATCRTRNALWNLPGLWGREYRRNFNFETFCELTIEFTTGLKATSVQLLHNFCLTFRVNRQTWHKVPAEPFKMAHHW